VERLADGVDVGAREGARPALRGCPLDCGLCRYHLGSLRLPVFSITNQCQLSCPICFTHNRADLVYHKSPEELERILDVIEEQSTSLDLINITGGEPALHPRLDSLLEQCSRRSFGRVSVNTNGLRLAHDEGLALRLKEAGVQVVLSLDTLEPETSQVIHGEDIAADKLMALEMLEKHRIPTVLLPVWVPGVNDGEIPRMIGRYFARPFVKGVTIQTIAYTGRNGSRFEPRARATIEEVENSLLPAGFKAADFFRHGSYHPLCYSVAYYLLDDSAMIPLSALADKSLLTAATRDGYLMRPTAELAASLRDKIDELWANGAPREELSLLKKLVSALASGRGGQASGPSAPGGQDRGLDGLREAAEETGIIKTVTIHAHMDQDNFDLARVALCGDLVPEEDGRWRPACAYNLLYRSLDPRFWAEGTPP
jgi:uncharacterized radical SAM superfamily Fe-S cluster-containing enzyme